MFGPRIVSFVAALVIAAPAFATNPHRVQTAEQARDYQAVSRFLTAVDRYVITHRVVAPIGPEFLCLPEGTVSAINDLAAIPIDARPGVHEGDIFTMDVADVFRDRIAGALRRYGINMWDVVSDMTEDEIAAPPAEVGGPLPWGVGDRSIGWLVAALPALPETLEYRLAGRDLVLFDVKDNVIVDVLRVAVPMY